VSGLEVRVVPLDGDCPERTAFDALPGLVYADLGSWSPRSEVVTRECIEDAVAGRVRMHAVVALRAGRPVARAAAFVGPAGQPAPSGTGARSGAASGSVGLVECLPDEPSAGQQVIMRCVRWLHHEQVGPLVAPRAPGLMSGLLVDGFDQPQTILTPYNPPGYGALLDSCGFRTATEMRAYRFTRERVPSFRGASAPGVRVRPADAGGLAAELERIAAFQRATFRGHPGHVDRTPGQMGLLAQRLGGALDPDLIMLAEDRSGVVVGVLICLVDTWQRRAEGTAPDRARLLSVGVLPGWRGRGIAMAMGQSLASALLERGYRTLEASWVARRNTRPNLLVRALGAEPVRRFELRQWAPPNTTC
jgi:ribosomal protein S18 acetylase RimI-like enzyme